MATPDQEAQLQEITQLIRMIAGLDVTFMVRERDLGTVFNFGEARDEFERLSKFCVRLGESQLNLTPPRRRGQLRNVLQEVSNVLDKIVSFSPDQPNPTQERDRLITEVRSQYEKLYEVAAPATAVGRPPELDIAGETARLREAIESTEQNLAAAQSQAAAHSDEIQKILATARGLAAEIGVVQHAVHFSDAAEEHRKHGAKWLIATAAFAGAAAILAAGSAIWYVLDPPMWPATQAFQVGVAKFVVLSLLVSATVWSGRIFRAHRHNYVVNRHRQHALSTFQTFATSAADAQTKSAVLIQASQSVFAPQSSGFDAGESDLGSAPQLVEVFRNIGG